MLTHLDLFSGIGGFSLAAEWAGFKTIGFVEIDKYCQKVLRKHWPDVSIVGDIRDVEKIKEIVANTTQQPKREPEYESDTKPIKREAWALPSSRGTDAGNGGAKPQSPAILVTAGFPCQPFSVAGKRQSKGDDRYLWPETLAVIKEVKPRWILLENVTGIINLALDTVLSDLEGAGYSYETLIIPACAVNAPHRRDRIWIVGYTTGNGQSDTEARRRIEPRNQRGKEGANQICQSKGASGLWQADVADSTRKRLSDRGRTQVGKHTREEPKSHRCDSSLKGLQNVTSGIAGEGWWAVEPELGRVANGIPNRVDRLKCLGNAIVPQVAYQIMKVIAEIENGDL